MMANEEALWASHCTHCWGNQTGLDTRIHWCNDTGALGVRYFVFLLLMRYFRDTRRLGVHGTLATTS